MADLAGSPLGEPGARPVILIVEDDRSVAQTLHDILEEEGYTVLHVDRGDAALAILANPPSAVDLIVLDLILPDSDGLQLLPALRERAGDPGLPVIIATARGMPADRAAAIKGKADDFLVKPVLPEELLAKVRMLLFRRGLERQTRWLAAVCRVARAVNSSLDVHAVLERGLNYTMKVLSADGGVIRLCEEDEGFLSLKAHRGILPALLQRLVRTPLLPEFRALRAPLMVDLRGTLPEVGAGFREELTLFREAGFGGAMLVPLVAKTRFGGILGTYTRRPVAVAAQATPALLAIGDLIATALENARLHGQVTGQALTDVLTGLPNRRHFLDRLREEVARAGRSLRPLALLLLDLDHFKRVNDRWGHPAGDVVLRRLGRLLRVTLRATDILCRYGGEEFAALLPETPRQQAVQVAERLRKAVERGAHSTGASGEPLYVTISIGVATLPEDGSSPEALLGCADRALYLAKEGGRNCVRPTGASSIETPESF